MSDNLPNTSFYYDMSTAKGMDTFLKHIHTIVKSNPVASPVVSLSRTPCIRSYQGVC